MELLLAIAIILIGLLLIVAEVYFIPGFNVVGILGFMCIVVALGYVFLTFGLGGGLLAFVGTVAVGAGVFMWMLRTGAWDRFVLTTTLRQDEHLVARESEQRERYLGKTGVALTPLRPTGIVEIDGERLEVVTEGEFIAAGSAVRVVARDRRRYFVRLASTPEPRTTPHPE